jgi:hypothetical protein
MACLNPVAGEERHERAQFEKVAMAMGEVSWRYVGKKLNRLVMESQVSYIIL